MPRLVAYYRVSTNKQGIVGLGMEAQQAAVNGYAGTTGSTIVASYREVETGKRSDRPELARALAHAKRIGAVLVIAKLDRLARNVFFLSGLMESGVDFVACDMPHANRFTLHIMAAVAEEEARAISCRTKAALAAYKARGGKLGTPANLKPEVMAAGQRLGTAMMKAAADAAYGDLVPLLREWRGLSLRAIAALLNERGRTTRQGRAWTHTQVRRVLARCRGLESAG